MKKQLIVDYTKKDASLKIFPSKPTLSTSHQDIRFEYHDLEPNEVPEHLPAQHTIVILHDPSKKVCRRMGDKIVSESAKSGDIVVSPAKVPHHVFWEEQASFSLFSINEKSIALAGYEFIDPDRVELLPHFAQPDPFIYGIGDMFKRKLESGVSISPIYVDQVTSFLAVYLLENYCSIQHKIPENNTSFSSSELKKVVDYFEAHIDRQIRLEEICRLLGMSKFHFLRLFKRAVGVPPGQYLLNRRLEKTASLLRHTNLDLEAIARCTGFSSHNYLCKAFKDRFSITPNKYRKSI